ncbi:3'-5' exonuclease [Aeromicrobium sp.]
MGFPTQLIRRLGPRRPWATPEDSPWRRATFCVIDLETTGLDPTRDEIISIGAVKVREGRITAESLYRLASPSGEISEESMTIHSILPAELEGCPPIGELLEEVRAFTEGSILVAHAAWFERAFLNRALKSRGERLPKAIVDTAALARHLGIVAGGDREPSLEYLARRLGLPVHAPHHALGDAFTTAMTLLAMVSQMEAGGREISTGELVRLSL